MACLAACGPSGTQAYRPGTAAGGLTESRLADGEGKTNSRGGVYGVCCGDLIGHGGERADEVDER